MQRVLEFLLNVIYLYSFLLYILLAKRTLYDPQPLSLRVYIFVSFWMCVRGGGSTAILIAGLLSKFFDIKSLTQFNSRSIVPSNDVCKYQVYSVQSQLVVIIALGSSTHHWRSTDYFQSITKFTEPSNQYISHYQKKFGRENSENLLQLWTFCLGSIFMNFYGVVGH